MSKTFKAVENGVEVSTLVPEDIPTFFGDGFGPSLFGFPITTVTLVQQQLADIGRESAEKKAVCKIQVPTLALLELADNIRKSMRENSPMVESALTGMRATIFKDA